MQLKVEYLEPDKLIPFDKNPRFIDESGLEKLQLSLEHFGFVNPILVQEKTNIVIAGHQRLKASIEAGFDRVPVIFLPMDDKTAKAFNIADNRLQDESDWDEDKLTAMLKDLGQERYDLTNTGFDELELLAYLEEQDDRMDDFFNGSHKTGEKEKKVCPNCGYEFE